MPKGLKNVYPRNIRIRRIIDESRKIVCYDKCTFVEGITILQNSEVKQIITGRKEKNLVMPEGINNLLREKFETINNSCVLTIKNKNITKKGLTCYGICQHLTSKLFKLVIENETKDTKAQMKVLSNNPDYSHGGKLTTFLKGAKRERFRQILSSNN